MDFRKLALQKHKELRGKIEVTLKDKLDSQDKLSTYYTPGVAAVSSYVAEHPEEARDYTWLNNSVAVISDGSAVSFGGINLEDIAAPICFEVEDRVKAALNIPVMHDDQHGTAVVVLAGLINAMKVTGRQLRDCRIVIVGAGAAGTAIIKLLHEYAAPEILAVDSKGIVSTHRTDLNSEKKRLLKFTNKANLSGSLEAALSNADIFIGVSKAGLLTQAMVKTMAKDPIIFAMANPVPEIMPDEAKKAGVAVMATGRSDFPNQVNNALAFPGIFRGALDNRVNKITDDHKIAAAKVIAGLIRKPSANQIIPSVLDDRLVPAIAKVIV
jgi:malate dehydrogenase (oxaloacetate-decarboxylating)